MNPPYCQIPQTSTNTLSKIFVNPTMLLVEKLKKMIENDTTKHDTLLKPKKESIVYQEE